jgi:hypothetical protein
MRVRVPVYVGVGMGRRAHVIWEQMAAWRDDVLAAEVAAMLTVRAQANAVLERARAAKYATATGTHTKA